MSYDLVYQLLDHATPRRIIKEVEARLAREKKARAEFREWLKPDVKAEFINGEIIMHSPAKRRHNQTVRFITFLIDAFISRNELGEVAVEKALIRLERHDVEPDVCFWLQETADDFTDEMNIYPAPDLVVEVLSDSTEARDRGVKKEAYEADGVQEYWIVNSALKTIEQYLLQKNKHGRMRYALVEEYGIEQEISSEVLVGFSIPVRACFERGARKEAMRRLVGKE